VIDVFVKVWAASAMRAMLAGAVMERLAKFEDARVTALMAAGTTVDGTPRIPVTPNTEGFAMATLPRDRFWITSKQYAEDHAESPIYVVLDDDHLPIGKDWLSAGVETLLRYPDFAMLSSWSINGEVSPPQGGGRVSYVDADLFESPSSTGTPYFVRRGDLGQLPDGPLESYDTVLSDHVRAKGRIGFLRHVRHNHLGAHYSQVVPGHWGA
jgi:hypothetical protein